MSLYNMLCGQHPLTPLFLAIYQISPEDMPRLRDCYVTADALKIVFFARIGGGNREEYQDVLARLKAYPSYVRDFDDDFDSTYCHIEFNVPNDADIRGALRGAAERFGSEKPMDKFQRVLKQMQEYKPGEQASPEVANALKVGEAILGQALGLLSGHRAVINNESGGVVLVSGGPGNVNIKSKDSK